MHVLPFEQRRQEEAQKQHLQKEQQRLRAGERRAEEEEEAHQHEQRQQMLQFELQAEEKNQRRNSEEGEARELDPEIIDRIRQNRDFAMQIKARASEMVAEGSGGA